MAVHRLFFFHNPKAAGSSVIKAIEAKLLAGGGRKSPQIAHTIRENARLEGNYDPFRGYDLYLGHYSREAFDAVRNGHAYITNFRHPVARVLSLYNYFRFSVPSGRRASRDEEIDFYCVDAAKQMRFDDFVRSRHPHILTYTSDAHFRQLTGSQWTLDNDPCSIESACDFIDGAMWYYVCEYPGISARWLNQTLEIDHVPTVNRTEAVSGIVRLGDVSRVTFDAILRINQRDAAIYRHAVKRLLEREAALSAGRQNTLATVP